MFPLAAPFGTFTVIDVFVQLAALPAGVPLKVTVLELCEEPKLHPEIVTAVPTAPEFGLRLEITGAVDTTKFVPLLAAPPTVTTTLPVVAPQGTFTVMLDELQLLALPADVPLKVTVLEP
jgi:hypothetical protein